MKKYSLKKNVVHITVENEDGNGTTEYQIREMTAAVRDVYLESLSDRVKIVDGKASGVGKFEGLQADLVSCCLFKGDGTAVSVGEIQTWPAVMVSELYKQAQDINSLDKEEAEAETKNE